MWKDITESAALRPSCLANFKVLKSIESASSSDYLCSSMKSMMVLRLGALLTIDRLSGVSF